MSTTLCKAAYQGPKRCFAAVAVTYGTVGSRVVLAAGAAIEPVYWMSTLQNFPTLESPRLRMREIILSDAAAYLAIFGNTSHMRFFGVDPLPNLAAAETLIDATLGSHNLEHPTMRWGIELKSAPGLIGNCGVFGWNKKWRKCSLGFALREECQGNGYMNEALVAALSWGFDFLSLNRIDAQVHIDNDRSIKVLERQKFLREGRLRQLAYWDGQYHDMLQYSLLHADWLP